MKKNINILNKNSNTTIFFKANHIKKYISNFTKTDKKIYCIIDKKVNKIIRINSKNKNLHIIEIDSGEKIKSFNFYSVLSEKLLSLSIDRNSILIAIGGGTLGDVCGFVASTLLRGVDFILIPTTLLSQVDSSIGGKNGINSKLGKNLIGTFYQPKEILIDINLLKYLPEREIKSGYAEIIKHALINDFSFFIWLDKNYKKIFSLHRKTLEKTILKSIMIKLKYVKIDQKEKLTNSNSRAMLNFGHTFGHALETFYKYKKELNHGEAISIGMMIESKISNKLGYLKNNQMEMIKNHFIKSNLKKDDKNITNKKIIQIIQKDKKNQKNQINLVLLNKIGKSFYGRNININKIKEIIKTV